MALSQTDQTAIQNASQQTGVPSYLLTAIATQETGGETNPDTAVSSTGATGLFQILPSTAASPGYGVTPLAATSLTDPNANALFAANYLKGLNQNSGSLNTAITEYSGGNYNLSTLQGKYPQLFVNQNTTGPYSTSGQVMADDPNDLPFGGGSDSSNLPAGANGTGNALSNATSALTTGAFSGVFGTIWEIAERGGVIVIGLLLLTIGLIFSLINSKSVNLPRSLLKG